MHYSCFGVAGWASYRFLDIKRNQVQKILWRSGMHALLSLATTLVQGDYDYWMS